MKTTTPLFILLLISTFSYTQPWLEKFKDTQPTFKEIQDAFYDYWDDRTVTKGSGYKQFKRWEWYWESRIPDDGKFPSPSITHDEWKKFLEANPEIMQRQSSAANWTFKGPSTTPGGYNGLGRLNCIAFHPTDPNTFWVGSPSGGLWKTSNGGSSWITHTDNLPVIGVSDIAIDPSDPSTMYIATGDGEAAGALPALGATANGDTKSIGVLKSTDGGVIWNTTGLNWDVTDAKLIKRLIINPDDPDILIAATSDGIWRTSNGGTTWNKEQSGYFTDVEFKTTDPDYVYASTYATDASIYQSTNSGSSWNLVATLSGVTRMNLAVTAHWPELVDALCANADGGLAGLWYSSNSGATFTNYFTGTCSNNMLNIAYDASGCNGQAWYDLSYAINPANSSDVWIGAVNTWNSIDGGTNWNLKTIWASGLPTSAPVVHADKHFLAFHPLLNNVLFECNDGGLYKTSNGGITWTDLSNGLEISQLYRIGVSQTISNNVICGMQDNGTQEVNNNNWYNRLGGDGMESIIDYVNAGTQYSSYSNGVLYRGNNFWSTNVKISDNIPGTPTGAWVTPFAIHPTNPQILFAGYKKVYKTSNQGNSWTEISAELTSDYLRSIAVAPSDPNTIYTASFDTLYFTTNGGLNWYYIPLAIPDAKISYLAVDPVNAQRMFMAVSGYSAGNKVFMTPDGGTTWYNYSANLPNVPVNCIVYEKGSNDGLYVGTDVGVFYGDDSMVDWVPFQNGLPNVVVTELEISYNDNKLWAATYGRGLWKSDLYSSIDVDEVNKEKLFSLYPNPNDGTFELTMLSERKYDLSIYNSLGQSVYKEEEITGLKKYFDIHMPAGIYFVSVKADGKKVSEKLVVH